jgi:hypothetical protein
MTTYFNARERDQLFRRIEQLTPQSRSRDGRVSGHELICHFNDALRDILRLQTPQRQGALWQRTVLKWLAFHVIPWPESQPKNETALKEFIGQQAPGTFEADHTAFVALLKAFEERSREKTLPPHPVFGTMSHDQWGQYLFLHLDYHLATFDIHGSAHALVAHPTKPVRAADR